MTMNLPLAIDFFGIIFASIAVVFVWSSLKKYGGVIGTALWLISLTIVFQILALVYTVVYVRLELFRFPGGIDTHHLWMVLGIIFFLIAANKLRKA